MLVPSPCIPVSHAGPPPPWPSAMGPSCSPWSTPLMRSGSRSSQWESAYQRARYRDLLDHSPRDSARSGCTLRYPKPPRRPGPLAIRTLHGLPRRETSGAPSDSIAVRSGNCGPDQGGDHSLDSIRTTWVQVDKFSAHQSARRATIGSTLDARRAGTQLATTAATPRRTTAAR
jgi:hypothetical protein